MLVHIKRYPQLKGLCWNRDADAVIGGAEALALYERNWRFVDREALDEEEQALLNRLVARYGNGTFLAA